MVPVPQERALRKISGEGGPSPDSCSTEKNGRIRDEAGIAKKEAADRNDPKSREKE